MAAHDLARRGGLVVTGAGLGPRRCGIGIRQGRIVTLAERIADADRRPDAGGLPVLPDGSVNEESFLTASAAAFAGGTPPAVCFVPRWKGQGVRERFRDHRARASRGMEGPEGTGWPVAALRRGARVMPDGAALAEPGSGRCLPRPPCPFVAPTGGLPHGLDAAPPHASA